MLRNLEKYSILFLILFLLSGLPAPAAQTETFIVARVVDGDTCILENSERVRYVEKQGQRLLLSHHIQASEYAREIKA